MGGSKNEWKRINGLWDVLRGVFCVFTFVPFGEDGSSLGTVPLYSENCLTCSQTDLLVFACLGRGQL